MSKSNISRVEAPWAAIETSLIIVLLYAPISVDFYKDRLTDEQLRDLEFPPTTPKTVKAKGTNAPRRRPSRPQKRVEVEEEEDVEE